MGSKGRVVRWQNHHSRRLRWTKWHWLPNPTMADFTACGRVPRRVLSTEERDDPLNNVDCANCRQRMY